MKSGDQDLRSSEMISRVFLPLVFWSACSVIGAQPNVVLFLADDMGWMDSGVYGSQYYETPNLDRFAKRAMRFTQAYAQPLCSPSRASILSGQYTARHGITTASGHQPPQAEGHVFRPASAPANVAMLLPESRNYLAPSQVTLAEALKGVGYRTAHIGKWHLGLTQPHWPEQQGFDVAFHCHPDPGPPGGYFSPYGVISEGRPNAKTRVGTITDGPEGEYIVDRLAEEAVKFIAASKGQPFFLNLWCYGVHGPWGHKEEYTRYFAAKKDPSGRQGNPIMASMLKSVDECFGRILQELEEKGLSDNTIILFNSDNGGNQHSNVSAEGKKAASADWQKWAGNQPPTQNTPLRDGKGTLYEGGTRVPLLWAWAGKIAPGTVTDAVVGPIDIYPTILDLAGVKKPEGQLLDGLSYAAVLQGEGDFPRQAYFNYHPHSGLHRAGGVWVRQGDLKLIRWFGNPSTHELYDLKADIGESNDLSAKMPERVRELDALIDGFHKETGALYPIPNPAHQPRVSQATAKSADPLEGWKERQCKATVADGILSLKGSGKTGASFLGHTMPKLVGPAVVRLRIKSAAGGPAKIDHLPKTSADSTEVVSTPFEVRAGDWQELEVRLSTKGNLGTMRVYLPDAEVDWIDVKPEKGSSERWDF